MTATKTQYSIRRLDGFNDPALDGATWPELMSRGETDTVFLSRWWQKSWWEAFGRGQLLLFCIYRGHRPVGLAPLFADGGMVFFTGSGGSDYLDFIGELPRGEVLGALLAQVIELVPGFVGFRFYHVPDASETGLKLQQAAKILGLDFYDEGDTPAPLIDLGVARPDITNKKSLVRHQRFFEREGDLSITHFTGAAEILPRLESFFAQHIARWAATDYPSLFLDPAQRHFYETLTQSAGPHPWLRFTEVSWGNSPIAYHFGFSYRGTYMWYKPSFAIELAKRSPGEVLLRNLLIASMEEGARIFDMGLGAEAFKQRFATHTARVRTWGLYPSAAAAVATGSQG